MSKPHISLHSLGLLAVIMLHWSTAKACHAQSELPRVFNGAPAAFWVFHPDAPGDQYGVFHFRRIVNLDTAPAEFVVHVSADNRYRLFVNRQQVASGPQRSDLLHRRYQTVDLAPYLSAGPNVLAALVWNWGSKRPVAQFSYRTVLGVRLAEPGFRAVHIAPRLGALRHVEGTVPHPYGNIDVELVRNDEDGLTATVTLPPGLSGSFEWRGERKSLQSGGQTLEF